MLSNYLVNKKNWLHDINPHPRFSGAVSRKFRPANGGPNPTHHCQRGRISMLMAVRYTSPSIPLSHTCTPLTEKKKRSRRLAKAEGIKTLFPRWASFLWHFRHRRHRWTASKRTFSRWISPRCPRPASPPAGNSWNDRRPLFPFL